MQLAINIFIFILGFSIAGVVRFRPKETRAALDDLLRKLRHVTNAFAPNGPNKLEPVIEKQRLVPAEGGHLLTMYVLHITIQNLFTNIHAELNANAYPKVPGSAKHMMLLKLSS